MLHCNKILVSPPKLYVNFTFILDFFFSVAYTSLMDYDTVQPSTALGFTLPAGPIPAVLPPLSEDEDAEFLAELIRQKALVNVNTLNDVLTLRAVNPASTARVLVDALDANYKLSGLAAKNQAKEAVGGTVSITINMPSKATAPRIISGDTPAELVFDGA